MKKKLTDKERKYVQNRIKGNNQTESYRKAGYSVMNKRGDSVNAHHIEHRPHIQEAIERALVSQGATPEWAVNQIMKVAEQDEEYGAKRLASMNILELHGWNKAERPTMTLDINNAFFGGGRADETRQPEQTEED